LALKRKNLTNGRIKPDRATGSRAEVVELLRRGVATVADLAKQLRLTPNAVRFHLASLQQAGLARATGTRQGKRRAHVTYTLTERANQRFPNAYKFSLRELLTELKHRYSRRTVTAILRGAGNRLAQRPPSKRSNASLGSRAREAARLIEAVGGSISIEPNHRVFFLRGDGCPLAGVVADHPEVCDMLETFLARSTGASVKQQCHHGLNPRCEFQIRSLAQGNA
jgi:predicted ArsR family transcriptional regulator